MDLVGAEFCYILRIFYLVFGWQEADFVDFSFGEPNNVTCKICFFFKCLTDVILGAQIYCAQNWYTVVAIELRHLLDLINQQGFDLASAVTLILQMQK